MPPLVTTGLSPKAIAGTVLATLLGVAVALLNAVQADPTLLGALPGWAQFVILLAIPPVLIGFGTYNAKPGQVEPARAAV